MGRTGATQAPGKLRGAARVGGAALLTLAVLSGCRNADRSSTFVAAPTQEEIPEIEFPQSKYPVAVGVIGASRRDPHTPFLHKFEPAQPTEEERRILEADPAPRKYDFLAGYPGPATPNVAQLDAAGPKVGVGGRGGASARQTMIPVKAGTHGEENPLVGRGPGKEFSAAQRNPRTAPSGVGNEEMVRVGRVPGGKRAAAERHRSQD